MYKRVKYVLKKLCAILTNIYVNKLFDRFRNIKITVTEINHFSQATLPKTFLPKRSFPIIHTPIISMCLYIWMIYYLLLTFLAKFSILII